MSKVFNRRTIKISQGYEGQMPSPSLSFSHLHCKAALMDGRPTAVNCYYYNLQPKYLRKQNVVGINREMSFP